MTGFRRQALGASFLAGFLIALAAAPSTQGGETTTTETLQIGVVSTLFRDVPEPMARTLLRPMRDLIVAQTGLAGDVVPAGDSQVLGRLLADDKFQLGVFHGFEFAWARQKYPKLLPLVIAVNKNRTLRAVVMVRTDSPAKSVADLRGKTLALPRFTREHARLFIERRCQEQGDCLAKFFEKVTTPDNVEDALDDLVDGDVQAAAIDAAALENFRQRKPARFAKIKILQKSESFPAAVIAYREGGLDNDRLQRFRDGLIGADQSERGERMLTLCRITRFESVPEDYDQLLLEIAKAYPPPVPAEKK